jgi:phosphoribosyl-ATP pyrophosphohydrolase/phosphoribosyl-AMP cyclohydrolase
MKLDFSKYKDGLIPAIVQDATTRQVLMQGFMNQEALDLTCESGRATFYSRSRQSLWTKGETSGNFLLVTEVRTDCDDDSILVKAEPAGPICHLGTPTCFGEQNEGIDFLFTLEGIIRGRKIKPSKNSYTTELFQKGLNRIAQKVGEEAVELIVEAKDDDPVRFKSEAADLLYHYLVLLAQEDVALADVVATLRSRNSQTRR